MRRARIVRRWRTAVALVALVAALPVCASQHTLDECFEGGDFIANAARARDLGMRAEKFLSRMREDFDLIQSFPNDLRWFVHDHDDEVFLLAEATMVFDDPLSPDAHRRDFLHDCVEQLALPQ
jgi:hypothetical protein